MMFHEILKNTLIIIVVFTFIISISTLNVRLYSSYLGKRLVGNDRLLIVGLIKSLFYDLYTDRALKHFFVGLSVIFLLVIGVGCFPLTSNVWLQGSLFKTQIFTFPNDFLIVSSIIILISCLDIFKTISNFKYNDLDNLISKLLFLSTLIINKISIMLFYRTTDINAIVQYQLGGTTDIIPNLIAIKNPFLFISSFSIFLIFISDFKYSKEVKSEEIEGRHINKFLIKNFKHFLSTQYIVYFFLGGYSFFLIPEEILDSVPLLFNVVQLISLYIKLVLVYVTLGFFVNKIKKYGSRSFKYFFMNLTLKCSMLGMAIEMTREILYGVY